MISILKGIFLGIKATHNYPEFNLVTYWNRGGREFIISTIHIALIILIVKVFFVRKLIPDIFSLHDEKRRSMIISVFISWVFFGFWYFLLPMKYHISNRDGKMVFLQRSLMTARVCVDKYTFLKRSLLSHRDLPFANTLRQHFVYEFMKLWAVDFTRSGIKRVWERGLKWHLWHRFLRAARIGIHVSIFLFA